MCIAAAEERVDNRGSDSGVIMSILATCRNHNVNPRAYLNDIISRMPYMTKATHDELVELLPHKWKPSHEEHVLEDFRQLQKS